MTKHRQEASILARAAHGAPILDATTERALLLAAKAGDRRAEERLVAAHLRIVFAIVRSHVRTNVGVDDLVSEGTLGLVEAVRRFDVTRENRFAVYAAWWIKAHVRQFVAKNRRIMAPASTRNARVLYRSLDRTARVIAQREGRPAAREEIAAELRVSVNEVELVEGMLRGTDVCMGPTAHGTTYELPCSHPSPEQIVAEAETHGHLRASIESAVSSLSEREKTIVKLRLLTDDDETLSTLGQSFGVSRERVRQIQRRVENRLRGQLAAYAVAV